MHWVLELEVRGPDLVAWHHLSYWYVGYSESKYRLRISLAHPRDCPFAYVQ